MLGKEEKQLRDNCIITRVAEGKLAFLLCDKDTMGLQGSYGCFHGRSIFGAGNIC